MCKREKVRFLTCDSYLFITLALKFEQTPTPTLDYLIICLALLMEWERVDPDQTASLEPKSEHCISVVSDMASPTGLTLLNVLVPF